MLARVICPLLVVAGISFSTSSARAQAIPSPAQAQQMLQNNPQLIARLQQMMQSSGMTPEQVRTRLRAQGYPESLLDQYLPGGQVADTTSQVGGDVFAAVRSLGLGDLAAIDSATAVRANQRSNEISDSAFLDTLQRALRNDTTAAAMRALLRSTAAQRQQMDSGFMVFGLNMFDDATSQFDPKMAVGADPNYRFGPGDQLTLVLTGDVERVSALTVSRDGFILIPDVGLVNVAGSTRSQLDDMLYRRLGTVYSGVRRGPGATTHFYVDLAQTGANQIFVNGDVRHPNAYQISRAGTVLTALYMAGGPTANGSLRNVQVKRNGQTAATLDVYDYALRGDGSGDIRLENGDIVFVPSRGPQTRVAGAVLRPATYEVKPNQTVAEVVEMAGGFTEKADRRRVQIERIVPVSERTTSGRDRVVLDMPPELLGTELVRGGDVIRVSEIAGRVANRVKVNGNVWSPGTVAFTGGMTLFDALRRAGGLKPDSYLGDVQVERLNADSTRSMQRSAVSDTVGHPVNNIVLADGDEITVFSKTDMRPNRYVTVGGAVRSPGIQIPYREGMTLRDAVLLSGGMLEGALLTEAEIARLPENRAAGVTAVTTSVPLDSTYLFERGTDGHLITPPGVIIPTAHAPQVELEPYDAVLIKWQPDWQLQQTVTISGEVKYPGDYSLVSKTEKLSDIIKRAGGLTPAAYAGGVSFVRAKNSVGRIGIDLPAVLRDPNNSDNLQLADGDAITIPKFTPVVVVRGAVNSPLGVAYVKDADISYYVRSAGGETAQGDRHHAYVTQPNGKVETVHRRLFWRHEPDPQPGSTVIVPVKDPNDRLNWPQIATTATSILGSLVAIAAIVRR